MPLCIKLLIIFQAVFFSCTLNKINEYQYSEKVEFSTPIPFFITASSSDTIPEWLKFYLEGENGLWLNGNKNLEQLAENYGSYVFVIEERGRNLAALERWRARFRIEQDFPQAVFTRMYGYLISESGGRPDYYFGDFYESFLKKISAGKFKNAEVQDSFWLKVSMKKQEAISETEYGTPDQLTGAETTEEEFRYYILAKISRAQLRSELTALFEEARAETKAEKFQSNAIDKLSGSLFAGF